MAKKFSLVVDAMHWGGHKDCSPLFNKKFVLALKRINSSMVEQKNRRINFMKTSVGFMSQPRGLVLVRYERQLLL